MPDRRVEDGVRTRKGIHVLSVVLQAVAVAFLCGGVLIAAGCDSPAATTTTAEASTTATASTTTEQSAITTEATRLYPVSVDGKWGFIDKTGTIKIQPQFVKVRDFCEGLAAVEVATNDGTKSGYIDTSGTMVIEPRFDSAYDFSEGLAVVGNKTGLDGELSGEFGYIDTSGNLVIPIGHNTASQFSEGLAWFTLMEEGYPTYFMDMTGATVLGPFYFVLDFSEGLAYVEADGKCGYIDKTGRRVIDLPKNLARSSHASSCFSDGLAAVQSSDEEGVPHDGFVNASGVVVIAPTFNGASDFSEGLAAACVATNGVWKWGYIDKTGAWVIKQQFDMAYDFSEGLAAVMYVENDVVSYGYIDTAGTMVIPPQQCTGAGPFVDGVAALTGLGTADDKTPSYIDRTGTVIWRGPWAGAPRLPTSVIEAGRAVTLGGRT